MTFADLKSPVLFTILGAFAAGWVALYWIMASQVTAAEDTALEMHGQQESTLDGIQAQLGEMNEKLGRIDGTTTRNSTQLDNIQEAIHRLNDVLLQSQQAQNKQ